MSPDDRTERLLAMILLQNLKEEPQTKKAEILQRVGFANAAIAELLGTTPGVIAQQLYAARSGTKPKASIKPRKLRQHSKK